MHGLVIVVLFIAIVAAFIIYNRIASAGIKSVNASVAQDLIKESGVLILDVRTSQEFRGGHIKGAKLLPVSELAGKIGEIADWKDRQVLTYCHSGSRSAAACRILKKNGFTKIANLKGGIMSWNSMGFKTVT
jgi:rhodanese-related sulfurtransferase